MYHQLKPLRAKTNLLGKRIVKSMPTYTREKETMAICGQANLRDTTEKVAQVKSVIVFLVDNYWSQVV